MNIHELINAFDPLYMILVNFYWLLFLIPGYTIWKFLKNKRIYHLNDGLAGAFVFSFFYSSLLLLPFNILQFLVTIPSIVVTSYFLVALILSFYYLMVTKDFLLNPKLVIAEIKKRKTSLGIFLSILLTGYFIFGQIIKSFALFEFDAWMHISKINFMMHNGLSNLDPYLFVPGVKVIQSSFFSNLVHTIFIPAAKIYSYIGLNTPYIWYYSISVFSLFAYAAVYFFVKKITDNKNLSVLVLLLYFATTFATQNQWLSQYPTRVAFLFLLITFTFLIDYLWNSKKLISYPLFGLALGVLSVSFLHQIMASLGALFIVGLSVLTIFFREINFKKAAVVILAGFLALPTAIYTKINSTFIPKKVFALADSDDWIIRLSNKITMTKFPDQTLTAIFLITIIGLVILNLVIKNRASRLFVLYSVVFTNMLLYSPIFGLVNKFIPTWGIVRIDYYVVILNWLFIGTAIWYLIDFVFSKGKLDQANKVWLLFAVILMLTLPAQKDLKLFYDVSSWNQGSYLNIKDLLLFKNDIEANKIVLANKSLSFSIPGIYNAYSAVLDNERTTDSISTDERANDLINFFNSKESSAKKASLLKKYNVKYVIVGTKETKTFTVEEATRIGLREVNKSFAYTLYEF